MNQAIKASVAVLSFAGALACLGSLAHYAGAKSVQAHVSEPAPVTIPEVLITGDSRVIQVPEVVIVASPTPHKSSKLTSHRTSTSGRTVREHTLRQGGAPGAETVVYWDSAR